jgi:hypothetical protein
MGLSREDAERCGIDWDTGRLRAAGPGLAPAPDAPPPPRRRPAHVPGVMNQTEARFADRLQARKDAGEIEDYRFEPVTLELSPECEYTPDFLVVENDGTKHYYEIKGAFVRDDSIVKVKWAAWRYHEDTFTVARWSAKKARWTFRRIVGRA